MKETSEIIMHSMAYDICEENGWDVGGVVHSHSKVLTAFSMAGLDVETTALPEMMGNFHKIPCAPYGAPGTKFIMTMAEPYFAEGYRIVLLGNHGSLAVRQDCGGSHECCGSMRINSRTDFDYKIYTWRRSFIGCGRNSKIL